MSTRLKILCVVLLGAILSKTQAQALLEVTLNKTSSIVFPSAITAVDRGSRDILAQKVKGIENILQVKAGKPRFRDTNLTVITSDGNLHQFTVRYADIPRTFMLYADPIKEPAEIIFEQATTEAQLDKSASMILKSERSRAIKAVSKNQMKLALLGIYIQDNTLFYHLKVSNNSNIPFHTDLLRFYVRDKQRVKRTAAQEVPEVPVFHKGRSDLIKGKTSEELVFALPKFTIPDAKLLFIELMEKRGGRHLQLTIKNRTIVKAKLIPSV